MKRRKENRELEVLIEDCKRGNSKAQMEIYSQYFQAMYNIALRIINHEAEAEDVMQESFLKAFQKIDSFRGEVTFGAWLKKIVINKSLDAIKNRKAMISLETASDLPEDQASETYLKYSDLSIEHVKEAIMKLPEGYRVVLSLYLIEGYDHDEISQILDITNSTSRTQYHRARKLLAKKINELKAVS
ncbi:MAG TPA: RNA polymerase sigma factor [Bacteroidales bacterium]|nr:RNA polymerase sigma factor [Bacteroidales bacterium]